ncbi:FtsX-like permease family protein [Subtercola lobariae]|uniref:FtsX-like permease family protein n=1 Tax=Subtercola lobariae TaxID=1588641 RepID=UPI001943A5BD|nr:FtsX-like permease family protein [Subtercola lobariae]
MASFEVVKAVVREAVASACGARVASILTMTVVAVLCAVVVLTTGRSVGAQNAIVSSISNTATRSIVVRAPVSAGLDTGVLARLANASEISSAVAFGAADDVTNAAFAGGTRVSLRPEYTLDRPTGAAAATETETAAAGAAAAAAAPSPTASVPPAAATGDRAIPTEHSFVEASAAAARALGLADGVGAVSSVASGVSEGVEGRIALPDDLQFLDPVVVAPTALDLAAPQPVTVLVVVASSSEQVQAVAALVTSVLGLTDPAKVTVTTSAQLTALRDSVQAQLGAFGHSLTALVFGVGALMVAAILSGLVVLRRTDFGRRRALGASRSLIVMLLVCQVAALATVGSLAGCFAATIALILTGDPLPTVSFVAAAAVLAVLTAVAASIAPAVVASTRDPLRELRVA